jgi:hypothetical protein
MAEARHPYHEVVDRAMREPAYKARLQADPVAVLKEAGFDETFSGQVKVVENTANLSYLVIPQKPGALSDDQLETVAGGQAWQSVPYGVPYPYPAPYPYPYPYGGPIIVNDPNYTPGPILNNGKWDL